MPRKPKLDKQTVTVVLDGVPVAVTLHPPTGTRRSWYAYWAGLVTSRSTGQADFAAAVTTAEAMVRGWKQGSGGHRPIPTDDVMTEDEFEAIQRRHYTRKTDPTAKRRADKSLVVCLEAIRAFKTISGLDRIVLATPDDCAKFQTDALTKPKNWRQSYPRMQPAEKVERVSPNTVVKWSKALQAAFQRANLNAGKKCVRGVVAETKLLTSNPWNCFTWIEGREKLVRQLDAAEIDSLLNHLETRWRGMTAASLVAKVFLWSAGRQQEIVGLEWSSLRRMGTEVHFHIVGKWGIVRWFRIPSSLLTEMESFRTDSSFVFAAHTEQLRKFHQGSDRPDRAVRVSDSYSPQCLADWFADRMDDWSATLPGGHAHTHVLRKTTLQFARIGEDVNRAVAADARVGEAVMMASYVKEGDEQLRQSSNRTYARIVAALPPALATRLGCKADEGPTDPEAAVKAAVALGDWKLVAELSAMLVGRKPAG